MKWIPDYLRWARGFPCRWERYGALLFWLWLLILGPLQLLVSTLGMAVAYGWQSFGSWPDTFGVMVTKTVGLVVFGVVYVLG